MPVELAPRVGLSEATAHDKQLAWANSASARGLGSENRGNDPNMADEIIRHRSRKFVAVFSVQNVGEGMGEISRISKNDYIAEAYGIRSNPTPSATLLSRWQSPLSCCADFAFCAFQQSPDYMPDSLLLLSLGCSAW